VRSKTNVDVKCKLGLKGVSAAELRADKAAQNAVVAATQQCVGSDANVTIQNITDTSSTESLTTLWAEEEAWRQQQYPDIPEYSASVSDGGSLRGQFGLAAGGGVSISLLIRRVAERAGYGSNNAASCGTALINTLTTQVSSGTFAQVLQQTSSSSGSSTLSNVQVSPTVVAAVASIQYVLTSAPSTAPPTLSPTAIPSSLPTSSPTATPSFSPTHSPSASPSANTLSTTTSKSSDKTTVIVIAVVVPVVVVICALAAWFVATRYSICGREADVGDVEGGGVVLKEQPQQIDDLVGAPSEQSATPGLIIPASPSKPVSSKPQIRDTPERTPGASVAHTVPASPDFAASPSGHLNQVYPQPPMETDVEEREVYRRRRSEGQNRYDDDYVQPFRASVGRVSPDDDFSLNSAGVVPDPYCPPSPSESTFSARSKLI